MCDKVRDKCTKLFFSTTASFSQSRSQMFLSIKTWPHYNTRYTPSL